MVSILEPKGGLLCSHCLSTDRNDAHIQRRRWQIACHPHCPILIVHGLEQLKRSTAQSGWKLEAKQSLLLSRISKSKNFEILFFLCILADQDQILVCTVSTGAAPGLIQVQP